MSIEEVFDLKTTDWKCLIWRNFLIVRDIFICILSVVSSDSPGKKVCLYEIPFRIIKRNLQITVESNNVLEQKYERIVYQEKAEIYHPA